MRSRVHDLTPFLFQVSSSRTTRLWRYHQQTKHSMTRRSWTFQPPFQNLAHYQAGSTTPLSSSPGRSCSGRHLVLEREFSSFRNADSDRFGTRAKWSLGSGFWEVVSGTGFWGLVSGKWLLGSGFWGLVSGKCFSGEW